MSNSNPMNLNDLKRMNIQDLAHMAHEFKIDGSSNMRRQGLIFALLQSQADRKGEIYGEGVLETLPDGFGFLRSPKYNYFPGPDDIYVSLSELQRWFPIVMELQFSDLAIQVRGLEPLPLQERIARALVRYLRQLPDSTDVGPQWAG